MLLTTRRLLLAAVLLAGIAAVSTVPLWQWQAGLEWRLAVVSAKLDGRASAVGWTELMAALLPGRLLEESTITPTDATPEEACPINWETPIGSFYGHIRSLNELATTISEQSGGASTYDRDDVPIREGDVVMDIGSHLGTFTRIALNAGASKVIAVEAAPANAICYKRTFASEIAEGSVILIEAAAWKEPGELRFWSQPKRGGLGGHVDDQGTITVPAVTIDQVVAEAGVERVDYIKMDIEGAERDALLGARLVISEQSPRMAICVYHLPDDPEVIPSIVLDIEPAYNVGRTGKIAQFFR